MGMVEGGREEVGKFLGMGGCVLYCFQRNFWRGLFSNSPEQKRKRRKLIGHLGS
jgi:hypothetical protein